MKIKKTLLLLFLFLQSLFPQNYSPTVKNLIDQTNLDSLISYVRILSGEDYVMIGDSLVLIKHRKNSLGNDLALEYIKQKMNEFGYTAIVQNYSSTGKNLYAVQTGNLFPDSYFILCAHYDAVANFCADDNASGVAGVIEAARIFSGLEFNNSIIYAFWDEEEVGGMGSEFFAEQAYSNGVNILGVLNFEMSGWDSNNDYLMDIHTRPIQESVYLASLMKNVNSLYSISLNPVIYNPGTAASDHSNFWDYGFSAIVFSEAYYGGDFNPFYHTDLDRIQSFNLPYYHRIAKLTIASIASLANDGIITAVDETLTIPNSLSITNYPNPFNISTKVVYSVPEYSNLQIMLYSSIGEEVKNLVSGMHNAGNYEIEVDFNGLGSGNYFVVIRDDYHFKAHKLILIK